MFGWTMWLAGGGGAVVGIDEYIFGVIAGCLRFGNEFDFSDDGGGDRSGGGIISH